MHNLYLVPPHIHRETLIEFRVKAGGVIEFDVKVDGEPPPKIEWAINKQGIKTNNKTTKNNSKVSIFNLAISSLTTQEYNTKLKTINAVRADSGMYTIVATNENGRDEADVKVVVLGTCIK